MKLLVVTVNFRAATHVLKMLDALVPQLESVGDAQCWIVDNDSGDDSVAILNAAIASRGLQNRVRCIESQVNGGFGAGNNLAFRNALNLNEPPEFFYLLNPDAIPEEGTVQTLVDFLVHHPNAGVVGGDIHYLDGTLQCSAFRFPTIWGEVENYARLGIATRILAKYRISHGQLASARQVDWVSGASFMVRRGALERAGVFDEHFFLYFEEVDLCRRIKELGYEIYFVPQAGVLHDSGLTTGVGRPGQRLPRYWFESRAHYYRKAFGERYLLLLNVASAASLSVRRIREVLTHKANDTPHLLADLVRYGDIHVSCDERLPSRPRR